MVLMIVMVALAVCTQPLLAWVGYQVDCWCCIVSMYQHALSLRSMGALLATHLVLTQTPIEQHTDTTSYDGYLLRAAEDLALRLLPAFDTETGCAAAHRDMPCHASTIHAMQALYMPCKQYTPCKYYTCHASTIHAMQAVHAMQAIHAMQQCIEDATTHRPAPVMGQLGNRPCARRRTCDLYCLRRDTGA